ncbi:MAG TPA: hypothetical protein PKA53_11250 [Sphingobacterium sp.]|nr:hypothetical protein [Sphingobacterium sp.]
MSLSEGHIVNLTVIPELIFKLAQASACDRYSTGTPCAFITVTRTTALTDRRELIEDNPCARLEKYWRAGLPIFGTGSPKKSG